MATYLVTVRERIDYTFRVDAADPARAADAAVAAIPAATLAADRAMASMRAERAVCGPTMPECRDVEVADRQVIETEEL